MTGANGYDYTDLSHAVKIAQKELKSYIYGFSTQRDVIAAAREAKQIYDAMPRWAQRSWTGPTAYKKEDK